jgi:hypothetical protein
MDKSFSILSQDLRRRREGEQTSFAGDDLMRGSEDEISCLQLAGTQRDVYTFPVVSDIACV